MDPRLTRVSKICLALPETSRTTHGSNTTHGPHASFLVRKKVFAYYLDNHHGDGIVSICCKVAPGDNTELIRAQPERFYSPAYIGPRGWAGLRLDRGEIDWEEVAELVTESYRRCAPKTLAAKVGVCG